MSGPPVIASLCSKLHTTRIIFSLLKRSMAPHHLPPRHKNSSGFLKFMTRLSRCSCEAALTSGHTKTFREEGASSQRAPHSLLSTSPRGAGHLPPRAPSSLGCKVVLIPVPMVVAPSQGLWGTGDMAQRAQLGVRPVPNDGTSRAVQSSPRPSTQALERGQNPQ